jgi:hypothetical protein
VLYFSLNREDADDAFRLCDLLVILIVDSVLMFGERRNCKILGEEESGSAHVQHKYQHHVITLYVIYVDIEWKG